MAGKKILVTGPESSGTKMMSDLMRKAGAEVTHSSPNYLMWDGRLPHRARDFDAVIIIVRSWYPNVVSMMEAGHIDSDLRGRVVAAGGLLYILQNLQSLDNVYIITYEDFTGKWKHEAMERLCVALGLERHKHEDIVGDGNAKYYGGQRFRDQRELHER